jgi:hypothetical protein
VNGINNQKLRALCVDKSENEILGMLGVCLPLRFGFTGTVQSRTVSFRDLMSVFGITDYKLNQKLEAFKAETEELATNEGAMIHGNLKTILNTAKATGCAFTEEQERLLAGFLKATTDNEQET